MQYGLVFLVFAYFAKIRVFFVIQTLFSFTFATTVISVVECSMGWFSPSLRISQKPWILEQKHANFREIRKDGEK